MCGPALHLLKPILKHAQDLGAGGTAGPDIEVPQVEVLRAAVQQPHPAAERQPLAAGVGDGVAEPRVPQQLGVGELLPAVQRDPSACTKVPCVREHQAHVGMRAWRPRCGNSRRATLSASATGTSSGSPTQSQLINWRLPRRKAGLKPLLLAQPDVGQVCQAALPRLLHRIQRAEDWQGWPTHGSQSTPQQTLEPVALVAERLELLGAGAVAAPASARGTSAQSAPSARR